MLLDYEKIGSRLRECRKIRKLSQEKVAALAEVGVTHISHIETGRTVPSLKTFVAILNALDISADEVLGGFINQSMHVLENEYATILSSCEIEDAMIIIEVSNVLKNNLQKRRLTL